MLAWRMICFLFYLSFDWWAVLTIKPIHQPLNLRHQSLFTTQYRKGMKWKNTTSGYKVYEEQCGYEQTQRVGMFPPSPP